MRSWNKRSLNQILTTYISDLQMELFNVHLKILRVTKVFGAEMTGNVLCSYFDVSLKNQDDKEI